MSDYYQVFVPADVYWQPSADGADAAVSLLRSILPGFNAITADFSDALSFQDPGGNWSGVRCPKCGTDVEAWFAATMTARHESADEDLAVVMPCCKASSRLDVLDFVWPASFFRFRIEVMNPSVIITDAQMRQLETCLGTKLKVIWRRI